MASHISYVACIYDSKWTYRYLNVIEEAYIGTSMSLRKHKILGNNTHLQYTHYHVTKNCFLKTQFHNFNWNAVYIECVIRFFVKFYSRGKKNQNLFFCFLADILIYYRSIGTQSLKWLFTCSIFSKIDFVNLKKRENHLSRILFLLLIRKEMR